MEVGRLVKEDKNINDLLATLQTWKDRGMKGSGIIGAYHARRVVPLMARALPLHRMVPGVSFEGMVLVDEALPPSEVAQRIKEVMEPTKDSASDILDHVYPMLGHPLMRPEPRVFDFVSFLSPRSSFRSNFRPLDANFGMVGPAEETLFQGESSPRAKGPGCGGGELHRG